MQITRTDMVVATLVAVAASIYLCLTDQLVLGGFAGLAGGWAFFDVIRRWRQR